jgi:large subunit ribosomal protein L15
MLHELISNTSSRKNAKRVGRGGKRGKTSGRGTKGQRAHGGHGIRAEVRDFIRKFPKLRGRGISLNKPVTPLSLVVNLSRIETLFNNGETVNPGTLVEKGFLTPHKASKADVKILAHGTLTKKLTFEGCLVSEGAKTKIIAAGGTVA